MNDEEAAVKAANRLRVQLGEMPINANIVAQPRGHSHVLVVFCTHEAMARVQRRAPKELGGFPVEILLRPQKGSTPGLRLNMNHGRIVLRDK